MSKLLDFIFGKAPDIFDSKGGVLHKLPQERWQQWNDRFQKSNDYNWRDHKGTERKISKGPLPDPKPQAPPSVAPMASTSPQKK